MIYRLLYIAVLFIGITFCSLAQSHENEGVFAFAYDENGKMKSDESIPDHKYEQAEEVFQNLVEAKGNRNMPVPNFVMLNSERRPAWAKPSEALVVLEEKAYDICTQMGADSLNAISALIAHELIHYYEKHNWKSHFISKNENLGLTGTSENPQDAMDLEMQADHLGGLLAHMAGYKTLGVLPGLLTKIYEEYHLDDESNETYPSLENRRKIARNSEVLLTEHSRIFDMAVYLTASGSYEKAKSYLDYLLTETQFQSREIYNNIGVLSTLMAIDMFPAEEVKYLFPIELETTTRLTTRNSNLTERTKLLDEAGSYFKNAAILDEAYAPALLNQAIVFALQREFYDADYYANKAKHIFGKNLNQNGTKNAIVVLGIIEAMQENHSEAEQYFLDAKNQLGRLNLCLLNQEEDCIETKRKEYSKNQVQIDEVDLNQLYSKIMQDQEQALLSIDIDIYNSFHTIAKPQSEILLNLNHEQMGNYIFYQIIKDPTIKYENDIGVGTPIEKLRNEMGTPTNEVFSSHQILMNYKQQNVFFIIDENDKIKEWSLYKINP